MAQTAPASPSNPPGGDPQTPPGSGEDFPAPVGTLFVLVLYVIIMAGMWGSIYWIMLQRA